MQDYFTDYAIINHLCKERIKLAGSLHDRQYIRRLAGHHREAQPAHPFYRLLPPRKQWNAYRRRFRSPDTNPDLAALKYAVRVLRNQQPEPLWVTELNRYIAGISRRVFGCNAFGFTSPDIRWKRKTEGGHEYRALCRFSPDDNLILCLFARYLRDKFDAGFSASSFAFRALNTQGQIPTHTDAFNELFALRQSAPAQDLYVAECDIRGFFDAVNHELALTAFQQAAAGRNLHPRSEAIFRAYLNCYSFPINVLAEATPRLRAEDAEGFFKWPEAELRKFHANPRNQRIGIPQGGAISGVIANLMLDAADKVVEGQPDDRSIHYYRFCDDMVLISPNKTHCETAFKAYLNKLTDLQLPYHAPESTCVYGAKHWEHKSKSPYCWSGRKWFGCVPWVQFVGYQIRYDGLVRPRKDSIRKQAKKIQETTQKLVGGLFRASQEQQILASRGQVHASLRAKLTAQGVGKVNWNPVNGPRLMCWAAGFKGLHEKPFIPGSLRFLDHARTQQIRRFSAVRIPFGDGRMGQSTNRTSPIGYAFSYDGQFTNTGGRQLIENPWHPHNLMEKGQSYLYYNTQSFYKWCRKTIDKL